MHSLNFRLSRIILILAIFMSPLLSNTRTGQASSSGENIWTWTGISGGVIDLYSNPLDPEIIYASSSGIIRSLDNGTTWKNISPFFNSLGYGGYIVAPSNSKVVYYLTSKLPVVLYHSIDAGESWTEVPGLSTLPAAISPLDWKEFYIRVKDGVQGLYKTTNGGENFIDLTSNLIAGCGSVDGLNQGPFIAPSSPLTLFILGIGTQGCKSVDGGLTWYPLVTPFEGVNTYAFVYDPKNSNTIYIGTLTGPGWKTINGGTNWFPMTNGLQSYSFSLVVNPDNTQIIYAANGPNGVMESQDGGASWTPLNTGLQGVYTRSIAIASRQPLKLLVGTYTAGLFELTRTEIQDYSISINDGDLFTNRPLC